MRSLLTKFRLPGGEGVLYGLLLLIAALLRLWDLDGRPLHFDESMHAKTAWDLSRGEGYVHQPVIHGPFQFYGTALIYLLFGASDSTARFLPVLFGTALVGLPYLLRRFLGREGSLAAAALIAFSPSLLYLSRFARNDTYITVWTLLLVIFLWRYLEGGRALYLYLSAAILSLSFATKEVTYVTVAILGSFLLLLNFRELLGRLLKGLKFSSLSRPASYLLLLGTLTLPLLGAAIGRPLGWLGLDLPSPIEKASQALVPGAIVLLLFLVSALFGVRWRWRLWVSCALLFYGLFAFLYTYFFINPQGFATALWGSLDFWLTKHGAGYAQQPWYYYLIVLAVYEFLPLTFALIAAVRYTLKGDLFSRFLVYWAALAFILYSFIGVKWPWLVVHMALPLILLSAKLLGELLGEIDWRKAWPFSLLVLLIVPLTLGAVRGVLGLSLALGVLLALLMALAFRGWVKSGLARGLQTLGLIALALLFALSLRTAYFVNYPRSADRAEMLVYAQSSPQVVEVAAEIGEMARERDLPITVDSSLYYGWPWSWYLRDYDVAYIDLSQESLPPGSLLVLAQRNEERHKPLLEGYGPGRGFSVMLWSPEYYRGLTLKGFFQKAGHLSSWKKAWRYFLYREIGLSPPLSEAVVYFPR